MCTYNTIKGYRQCTKVLAFTDVYAEDSSRKDLQKNVYNFSGTLQFYNIKLLN